MPSASFFSSQRLGNISIFGSNMGSHSVVHPQETICDSFTILTKKSSVFVCNISFQTLGAGAAITDASVSITFLDALRLDDVVISILSPLGKEYI
jgi:hypothetical protein